MAQQLMSGRPGMASGLILGLGFIMGAVGVPIMGAVADEWGIQNAMRLWALIAGLTIFVSMLLPTDAEVRRLTERPPAHPVPVPQPALASAKATKSSTIAVAAAGRPCPAISAMLGRPA